ncbi:tetratricopeptide repeat protein [Paludibacter sp.]|uniref:tetratricopeptide repeat protein n=1 Tax=Paludibacter sp. TaxID=1898105 RepID=UPI0013533F1F|nr:tetratricopeptide repeat protein [Paludibacter sp.]MTK54246.1 tetratricopeptide repeat protein [Paludibacter sp.]
MRQHSIIALVLFFFSLSVNAQTIAEGESLLNSQRYSEASRVFGNILKKRPNDGAANYGYGQCQNKLGNKEEAIKSLQIAVNKKIAAAYPLLCELCFEQYHFDEAISNIEAYLSSPKAMPAEAAKLNKLLEKAKIGAQLLQHVESITIIDSMQVAKNEFYKYYSMGKDLGTIIPSKQIRKNAPDGAMAYKSQRGDRVVFADSLKHKLGLYGTFQMIDSWSEPIPLSDQVNGTGNIINYPFVSSDGVTLYFAAQGANSLGGYDLFITRFNSKDNNYYAPQNLGFPFNSTANDYLMVVDEINNLGWFATDRSQPEGKVMIYKYLTNPEKKLIQSSDTNYLRLAAQLKSYKKGKAPKTIARNTVEQDLPATVKPSMEFRVNDTISYTSIDQFKSAKAREIYLQADSLEKAQTRLQGELNQQRSAYSATESAEERSKIQPEILRLEREVNGLINKPQNLYIQARQTEIEALIEKR